MAFGGSEAADAEDFEDSVRIASGRGAARKRREEVLIYAEAADVKLLPTFVRGEVHELAASE